MSLRGQKAYQVLLLKAYINAMCIFILYGSISPLFFAPFYSIGSLPIVCQLLLYDLLNMFTINFSWHKFGVRVNE